MGPLVRYATLARVTAKVRLVTSRQRIRGMSVRLEFTGKLATPSVRARANEVLRGAKATGPAILELDPTSNCDFECPSCISEGVLRTGSFTRERLNELADEIRDLGVLGVILIGGGEPLMHRGTPALIESLAGFGIEVGLVTNGSQLARHSRVIRDMCSWVRVSMDAATADTFQRLRPAPSKTFLFPGVTQAIREVARRPRKVQVGYSFVVHQDLPDRMGNLQETRDAIALAKELGCDYIELKGEMENTHKLRPLPAAVRDSLQDQIAQGRALASPTFSIEVNSGLEAQLRGDPDLGQPKLYTFCPVASLRTTVTASGCYTCSYHRGNSNHRIGDPQRESLDSIWANRRSVVNPSLDCGFHCARHELNLQLLSGRLPEPDPLRSDVFL